MQTVRSSQRVVVVGAERVRGGRKCRNLETLALINIVRMYAFRQRGSIVQDTIVQGMIYIQSTIT